MHQYILKLPTKFRLHFKIGSTSGNKEDVLHICFNTSKKQHFFHFVGECVPYRFWNTNAKSCFKQNYLFSRCRREAYWKILCILEVAVFGF